MKYQTRLLIKELLHEIGIFMKFLLKKCKIIFIILLKISLTLIILLITDVTLIVNGPHEAPQIMIPCIIFKIGINILIMKEIYINTIKDNIIQLMGDNFERKNYHHYKLDNPKSGYTKKQIITQKITRQIKKVDKNFNSTKFLIWAKNTFIDIQTALKENDFSAIKILETEKLLKKQSLKTQHYKNKAEKISINFAELLSFKQSEELDILKVIINYSVIGYKKKIKAKKEKNRVSKLIFIRKKGTLTEVNKEQIRKTNCPNCGAPNNIISTGKCEFCGSIIKINVDNWLLDDIKY